MTKLRLLNAAVSATFKISVDGHRCVNAFPFKPVTAAVTGFAARPDQCRTGVPGVVCH